MWFFIVFIVMLSLMVAGSLIAVPLIVKKDKFLWTIGCFIVSLLLLLLVISVYTGGGWFILTAVSVIFGLSLIFTPIALYKMPLSGAAARNKGLIAMSVNTLLLYIVILMSGGGLLSLFTATLSITLPWALLGIIRYTKVVLLAKWGLSIIVSGVYIFAIENIANRFHGVYITIVDVGFGNAENIRLFTLLGACVLGGLLLILSLLQKKKHV